MLIILFSVIFANTLRALREIFRYQAVGEIAGYRSQKLEDRS